MFAESTGSAGEAAGEGPGVGGGVGGQNGGGDNGAAAAGNEGGTNSLGAQVDEDATKGNPTGAVGIGSATGQAPRGDREFSPGGSTWFDIGWSCDGGRPGVCGPLVWTPGCTFFCPVSRDDRGGGGGGGGGVGGPPRAVSCTPVPVCAGTNLVNSCTGAVIQACAYGCVSGACLPPPLPSFVGFGATNPLGAFQANGHLQVKPELVASGNTTQVYWNTENVSGCTVTAPNGDSWTGASSGTSGRTSSPITAQTTYTLNCTPLPGAASGAIIETATVNIVPVFQEV